MNHLLNHMMLAFNRSMMNVGFPQLGIVTSVDPNDYAIKVLLQPQQIETGFIPYATPFYGFVAPLKGGEQCLVFFDHGNNNVPIGALVLYWNSFRAPGVSSDGDTEAGEILLKHISSGSYLKFKNNGQVIIHGANGIILDSATTELKGDAIIDGDLTANNGSISMSGGNFTTSQDVVAGTISLKTHVHSGVTSGTDDTGAPVP